MTVTPKTHQDLMRMAIKLSRQAVEHGIFFS